MSLCREHHDGEDELGCKQRFQKQALTDAGIACEVGRDGERAREQPLDSTSCQDGASQLSRHDHETSGPGDGSYHAKSKRNSRIKLATADPKEDPNRDGESDTETQADVENGLRIRTLGQVVAGVS